MTLFSHPLPSLFSSTIPFSHLVQGPQIFVLLIDPAISEKLTDALFCLQVEHFESHSDNSLDPLHCEIKVNMVGLTC